MTTKLTLKVEESVIKEAKSYAEQIGRSLPELVGSVRLPADFDEKKELDAYFESKHL